MKRSPATLIVHLSDDAPPMLEGAGPISPETAERLGCDARRLTIMRDWLRTHADDSALYANTKRSLAGRQWPDMNYYAEAKSPVIEAIKARARR